MYLASDFLAFVQNLIPHDKFDTFKTLFRYPVYTNDVTGICFDKLSRIFDGRNPAVNYQFMNTEQRDDWEYYRQEVLHEPEVWQTRGWDFFKTEINSVLVVDLPREHNVDGYPAPYFYWLPISAVIDYEVDALTGRMRHLIFKQPGDTIAVIDDEYYRVFEMRQQKIGALIVENPHDLGYCPAQFFWSEPLSIQEPDVKASPITKVLEQLDWLLFFHISKRHLDLFGAYPIYSGYAPNCDYSNTQGDVCDDGWLRNRDGNYYLDNAGLRMPCPKCGNKRIVGAGSFVEIPIPSDSQVDLRNPVQILSIDRNSLDYNVAEEERLRSSIITSVVGTAEEITNGAEAFNEQQVQASFESQSTVLNRIKKGFEQAQQFVDETICRLRYGEMFISARVNLGTEFYLYSISELRERYKTAMESGASESELDALQNQIIETEYRNNPAMLQRMLILSELEPYRHLSRAEVVELHAKGVIGQADMLVKLNFSDYIRRFERENSNIIEFGSDIPFMAKINTIRKELTNYTNHESENQS